MGGGVWFGAQERRMRLKGGKVYVQYTVATSVGSTLSAPRLLPLAAPFLFRLQPREDIPERFRAVVQERFDGVDHWLVERLHRKASALLLQSSAGIGAEVAKLKKQALFRIDEEALLDDAIQVQAPGHAAKGFLRFLTSNMTSRFSSEMKMPRGEPRCAFR